jgi:hypothetical protein
MGAWGVFSDENDWTWDALGGSIPERLEGANLKHASEKERAALSKDFDKSVVRKARGMELPGVLRWGLRNGLRILSTGKIKKAIEILRKELAPLEAGVNEPEWRDPEERICAIKEEIKALDYAIKHRGKGKTGPTHGIFGAKSCLHPKKSRMQLRKRTKKALKSSSKTKAAGTSMVKASRGPAKKPAKSKKPKKGSSAEPHPGHAAWRARVHAWTLRRAKKEQRYVVIKIKDWRGYKGPARLVLGSSRTLAGAKKIVDKGTHSGLHAIVDKKTGKTWSALVARTYKITMN